MGRLSPTIFLFAAILIQAGICPAQGIADPVPVVEDSLGVGQVETPSGTEPQVTGSSADPAPRGQRGSAGPGEDVDSGATAFRIPDRLVRDDRSVGGRNARLAMLTSLSFPGLGQLYNNEGWKTLLVFGWEAYYIARIVRDGRLADFYKRKADSLGEGETWRGLGYEDLRARFNRRIERETDYIWYSGALILASILDAYVFAHLHDFDIDDIRGRRASVLPMIDHEERSVGLQLWLQF
ncbi:MAG: hypothetical protein GY835_06010 [bacterium]|nr:hypothetical protein [bacterium]